MSNWDKKEDEAPESTKYLKSCYLCHKGLIRVAPELPDSGFTLDEYSIAYTATAPCTCASGGVMLKKILGPDGDYKILNQIRHKAVAQVTYAENLFYALGKERTKQLGMAGIMKSVAG